MGLQTGGARGVNGLRNLSENAAIPDSVVSRDDDDDTGGAGGTKYGIRISTSQEWPEIGAELSQNQDDSLTRAYIYRVSDEQLMGDADITGLSGGDTFTVDLDTKLSAGETYNFVADAEGASYNAGIDSDPTFPYTSADGNLEIVNGGTDASGTVDNPNCFLRVGNVEGN